MGSRTIYTDGIARARVCAVAFLTTLCASGVALTHTGYVPQLLALKTSCRVRDVRVTFTANVPDIDVGRMVRLCKSEQNSAGFSQFLNLADLLLSQLFEND